MSGHSKWSTIKRQKGVADALRGQRFTKLSNAITLAVRQGGGASDPNSNFKLRLAIEKARSANMPKDNITRAIAKGSGIGGADVTELMYEGFGPSGVGIIIEVVTDNKQRTVSEVKSTLEKNGGTLASPGAVSYLFKKRGELIIKKGEASADDLLNKALSANIDDFEETSDEMFLYVDPKALSQTKTKLEEEGLTIVSAQIVYISDTEVRLPDEKLGQIIALVDKLNSLDDVQEVYTNLG